MRAASVRSSSRVGAGAARRRLVVWDLTAGLGRDAVVLARAGFRVRMHEREPALGALLEVTG